MEHLSLWIAPGASYFLATDFAMGASLCLGSDSYDRADGWELDENSMGVSISTMYRAEISERVFVLPELSVGGVQVRRDRPVASYDRFDRYPLMSNEYLHATVFVPLAHSPVPGFYWGMGPYVRMRYATDWDLGPRRGEWALSIGLASALGTWL